MPWGRLDDRLDDDPRFAGISPSAAGVFFLRLPRCLRQYSGVIPDRIAALHPQERDELMGRGIWQPHPDGVAIVDDLWGEIRIPEALRSNPERSFERLPNGLRTVSKPRIPYPGSRRCSYHA